MFYILDDKGFPKLVPATPRAALWMHEWRRANFARCIVEQDFIDDLKVSTVFLGMDASGGVGCPILWETVIFLAEGNPYHYAQYTSKTEAEAGHLRALELVRTSRALLEKMVADE